MQVLVPDYSVDYLLPRLRAWDPDVRLIPMSVHGEYGESLAEVEVLYKYFIDHDPPYSFGREPLRGILRNAPKLRWIHSGKAGVEDMLVPELVESDIILTNGAGGPKLAIAEVVLAFILADAKAILPHLSAQRDKRWGFIPHRELPGLTAAVLGLGNIGLETARLCKAMGMRVIGTKRRVNGEPLPNVDEIFPPDRQDECVAQADYVVIAAASTPDTRGMVDSKTIAAMRPDAALINVARGAVIDEPAMIAALESGRLRAAYLDVVSREPLPQESPLWTLPNVMLHPHNSHDSQHLIDHMAGVFIDNFRRFCTGEPLENVVNKRAGY